MRTFQANLDDLQPSQLYICSDKLAAVERAMERTESAAINPLPVKRLGPRTVLTDGHTRAFAAFRQGSRSVPACWDTDDLDWEAYEICVEWCLEEGVRMVADLQTRLVTAEQYEELWLTRCRVMHEQLAEQRRRKPPASDSS